MPELIQIRKSFKSLFCDS